MRNSETHRALSFMLLVVVAGCWADDGPTLPEGNDKLGIVRFVEQETTDQTTLRGLDAQGNEVARLDLVHGWFALSPPFTEDYETPDVDGRKLNVHALGQRLHWETAGFEPVLKMPAQRPAQWALAAFIADPHAKRILDRWQIGFEAAAGEVGYFTDGGAWRGDSPQTCNNAATCGTAIAAIGAPETLCSDVVDNDGDGAINDGCPINTCGAGGIATQALRLTRQPGLNCGYYAGPAQQEVRVAQCCPSTTGPLGVAWYAEKACPTTTNSNTSCGLRTAGVCKSCPQYPLDANTQCDLWVDSVPIGTCNSRDMYDMAWWYTGSWYDDFTRTTGLGSAWFISQGSWSTDGNKAVSGTAGNNYARVETPGISGADYSVEAYITATSGNVNSVFARYDKNNPTMNLYAAAMSLDGYVSLRRQNGGTWTWLQQTRADLTVEENDGLKLIVTGSDPVRLQVWFDGVLKIYHEDSSANRVTVQGTGGMHTQTSGVKYDWFTMSKVAALTSPPGLPFVDDFNRVSFTNSDGTYGNGLGLTWITEQGPIKTDGVYAVAEGTGSHFAMPLVNLGTIDYAVQADMQTPNSSARPQVFARASDPEDAANNCYTARLSTTGVSLMRYNSYSSTTLASYSTTINTNTDYTVKLVATGTNPVHLEIWLNGTQRVTYNDSSASRHTSGDVGIATSSSSSTGIKWNAFRVDAM